MFVDGVVSSVVKDYGYGDKTNKLAGVAGDGDVVISAEHGGCNSPVNELNVVDSEENKGDCSRRQRKTKWSIKRMEGYSET